MTILTDKRNEAVVRKAIEASGILNSNEAKKYKFVLFPEINEDSFIQTFLSECNPKLDHLISIERPCAAPDGKYYNMRFVPYLFRYHLLLECNRFVKRGIDISEYVAKIDKLFDYVKKTPSLGIRTIGIGDGEFLNK